MRIITMTKKKGLFLGSFIASLLLIFACTTSFGMQHYYKLDFSTGLVTASKLNVRSGPGTGYSVVTTVNKNEYIRVFAGVGNWYIVQVDGDYVGAVSKQYIKPIYRSRLINKFWRSWFKFSVLELVKHLVVNHLEI